METETRARRTKDEAREQGLIGWNLRCNKCGDYGARWHQKERPGWGALALCDSCSLVLRKAHEALAEARKVNFEQV
jgi:hypothetical protein